MESMGFDPVTLWAEGPHRCVMRREYGRYELLLYTGDRATQLQAFASEHDARNTAQQWLVATKERSFQP